MSDDFNLQTGEYEQKSAKAAEVIESAQANMLWEVERRVAEALRQQAPEEETPPVPVALTFDINWKDGDRSPVMFCNILGSNIEDGLLRLYGPDDHAHIINMDVVSHINIWRHP